jgi:hypothetical protein
MSLVFLPISRRYVAMKEITITTQAELDALPDSFAEHTYIYLKTKDETWLSLTKTYHNATVVARESSHVEAWGSSHVVARGSSHVVARGSSHVAAWESSHVEAWESSHVGARGSSHVVARESSHVEAWESSHVVARGSSHVVARESSHVVARGSSHVEAWESSHVEARANASLKVQSKSVVVESLKEYAIAICIDQGCKVREKDDTAQVIVCPRVLYNIESFADIYRENKTSDSAMALYKIVKDDYTDFYTGKIKYAIGKKVKCPDWNPDPTIQCGGGLHLSPTVDTAKGYNQPGKILKCEVNLADIVVYGPDITKVRCSAVKVLEEIKA